MKRLKKIVWAVEYVEFGRRIVSLDPQKNSTPEEAKNAFAATKGIPWKELERRGAKVIQQEIPQLPPE